MQLNRVISVKPFTEIAIVVATNGIGYKSEVLFLYLTRPL